MGSNGREGRRKGCGWEVMAGRGDQTMVTEFSFSQEKSILSLFNWQTTRIVVDGGMRRGGTVVVGSNGREGRRKGCG